MRKEEERLTVVIENEFVEHSPARLLSDVLVHNLRAKLVQRDGVCQRLTENVSTRSISSLQRMAFMTNTSYGWLTMGCIYAQMPLWQTHYIRLLAVCGGQVYKSTRSTNGHFEVPWLKYAKDLFILMGTCMIGWCRVLWRRRWRTADRRSCRGSLPNNLDSFVPVVGCKRQPSHE